jgi:hypothetical protein
MIRYMYTSFMTMSRKKLLAVLRKLQQERRQRLRRLVRDHELAVGSVSVVARKCGNPTCGCASGLGHPQTLFLFSDEDGRRRCKLVRRADESRLQKAGERYRDFREDLKQLRAIDRREKEILMALRDQRAISYE